MYYKKKKQPHIPLILVCITLYNVILSLLYNVSLSLIKKWTLFLPPLKFGPAL